MDRGSNYYLLNSEDSFEMSNLTQARSSGNLNKFQSTSLSNPRHTTSQRNIQNLNPRPEYVPSSQSSYNPPNQGIPSEQPLKKIKCANCPTELSYAEEAYCVCCYNCKTLTAVKSLSLHLCLVCLTTIYYLTDQKIVKCRCGKVYDMSKTK